VPEQLTQTSLVPAIPDQVIEIFTKKKISTRVKRGDTFSSILSRYNIPPITINHVYKKLREAGLHAIFPGDSMVLTLKDSSTLQSLALTSKKTTRYIAQCSADTIEAFREDVPIQTQRCLARGVIKSSLSEDMIKIGIGDALVGKLMEIFAWDINFFTDPRKGDSVEFIFEKKFAEGEFIGYGDILAATYKGANGTFTAIGFKDSDTSQMHFFTPEGKSVQKEFLKAPLRYSRISSGYSYARRHPILGIVRPHLGIDYAAPRGTPVYASADGVVSYAGNAGGYGKHLRLKHRGAYTTYYGHLRGFARGIRKGKSVSQGQLIGWVGSSGLSTGPHLDYRMKIGKKFVNPLRIKPPEKSEISPKYVARFKTLRAETMIILANRFTDNHGQWVLDVLSPEEKTTAPMKLVKAHSEGKNASRTGS